VFLGHYGVAFALKRVEPKLSLGTLFVAVQLADLLWGVFLVLGWEHATIVPENPVIPLEFTDYPISHGLLGMALWSGVAAALYYSWPTRDTTRHWQASVLVGLAVLTHFPLDYLVHVRDLPLVDNNSLKVGLGLWNHPVAAMLAELLALSGGVAVYFGLRSLRHPVRPARLAVLILLLLATYFAAQHGPVPPNITTLGVSDVVLLLALAAVAAWADRRPTVAELEGRRVSSR
jgi:hypothetical protein